MEKKYSVYSICNPLMDLIYFADYPFLEGLKVKSGTMNLMSFDEIKELLGKIKTYDQVPGGSGANTMRGLSWLSKYKPIKPMVYCGAVGKDNRGDVYKLLMEVDFGIKSLISFKESGTGFSIIIITPDYERTMFTYLGACREFETKDVDLSILADSEIFHFTGYMWDTESQKAALKTAIQTARLNNVKIAFDLADPFVVQRYRDDFSKWLYKDVDILFGNQEELKILTGKTDEQEIVNEAGKYCKLTIMKAGPKGCYVNDNGTVFMQPGIKVNAIDTVGAGDSFASGFLYGMLTGKSLKESAVLANTLAANIVTVVGCNYQKLKYENVFK